MKTCTACNDTKDLSCFSVKRASKDGLDSRCKDCRKEMHRQWRLKNPEKVRELEKKHAEYRKRYKAQPHRREITRQKQAEPEAKAKRAARQRERRARDKDFAIKQRMTCAINSSLRKVGESKRGWSWTKLTGYTVAQLRAHLEAQFTKGMSWDNIGEWHIDHIIPLSAFKFESVHDPEFLECWSLSNLRPL